MSWTLDGRPLNRILVTRLRYLGDIAMSTVVLEVLRQGDPDVVLDYLCDAAHAPVLADHPLVNEVHALGVTRRGRDASARRHAAKLTAAPARGTVGTIVALRRSGYDAAIDLFFNPRSAWLLYLSGIPRRIAGVESRSRRRLYTHQALAPRVADQPELYARAPGVLGMHLSRLAPLRHADGRPFLQWLADEVPPGRLRPRMPRREATAAVTAVLGELGAQPDGYTLLAPAATWPSKAWPADHWRDLAADLVGDGHDVVVLCPPGGPGDYEAVGAVIPEGRGGLLPPLSLDGALTAVARARLLVSVDGGIMHTGVAMGVPTVGIFGPTNPDAWFPYESFGPYRVLATRPHCHPCNRLTCDEFICLPDLAPSAVRSVIGELMNGR